MKLNINLPMIVEVDDYHEFPPMQDLLRKLLGSKLKVKEVGCYGVYYGIVYYNKQDEAYKKLEGEIKKLCRLGAEAARRAPILRLPSSRDHRRALRYAGRWSTLEL
jgi:hypothetical protein